MAESQGVCVLAETSPSGDPTLLTLELMGLGGELASSQGERLSAVILGDGVAAAAEELTRYGADVVFYADHARLSEYNPDTYLPLLMKLCEDENLRMVLAGHTSVGQDLLPRLAFALRAGLITDCVGVEIDAGGKIVFTKPIYGGNALANLCTHSSTALATVRAKVGVAPPPSETGGRVAVLEAILPDEIRIEPKGKSLGKRESAIEEIGRASCRERV